MKQICLYFLSFQITLESKVLEEVDLTQKQHSINSFQEPAVSDVIQMTYSTFDDKFFEMLESDLAVAKDDTSIALITSDDEDYQVIEIKDELPKSEIAVAKDEPTIAPITSDDEDCQVIEIKDELPKSSIKIIRNKYIRSKNQRNMKVQLKALRKIRKLKKAYDELILMELDHNFSKCMIKIDQIHKKIIEIAAKNDLFHKIPEFLRKPKRVIRH